MRQTHKGDEVMLAHAGERNVTNEHQLVCVFLKCDSDFGSRIYTCSIYEFFEHAPDAGRSFGQPFAVNIFTHALKDKANAGFDLRRVEAALCRLFTTLRVFMRKTAIVLFLSRREGLLRTGDR